MQTVIAPTGLLLLQTRQAHSQPVRAWSGLVVLVSSKVHLKFLMVLLTRFECHVQRLDAHLMARVSLESSACA